MRPHSAAAALLLLTLTACNGGDPLAAPPSPPSPSNAAAAPVTSSPAPTPSPSASPLDAKKAADLMDRLREFARQPTTENFEEVPFADEVALGLGEGVVTVLAAEELRSPASWVLEMPGFRAYTGPFDLLESLGDPRAAKVSIGSHPHCASPPKSAPDGYIDAQRISTQPEEIDGCLQWYSVDVFVRDGVVTAVTYDVWEP